MTPSELLEQAFRDASGFGPTAAGILADKIAATPSGRELLALAGIGACLRDLGALPDDASVEHHPYATDPDRAWIARRSALVAVAIGSDAWQEANGYGPTAAAAVAALFARLGEGEP